MASAWNLTKGQWNVSWPERVSQHDIVFLTPPDDPMQGLPIGNGDLGAMLWTQGQCVHLAINKVDTWDDGPEGNFNLWEPSEEEQHTTLRSCGKLTLDLGLPLLDVAYLRDFKGRLSLADAKAILTSDTPLGWVNVEAYISQTHQVLVVNVETETSEAVSPKIIFERFGSRGFGHWYSQVNRDPSLGLDGTTTEIQNGRVILRQQLRTLHFVVAVAVVVNSPGVMELERLHSRSAQYTLHPRQKNRYSLYLTVVTSENDASPEVEAHRRLDAAISKGEASVYQKHAETWKEFWLRSWISLPDDYLANIWHTTLYLASSSMRGSSPPHFCNGLWGSNRDFVPWTYYYHWNTHWSVWPIHSAGLAELALPYLKFRFDQLSKAMLDAKQIFGVEGAAYADVSERRGYQTESRMRIVSIQIAMDFWRHYEYTGDREFLENKAYPVMREVARFIVNSLTLREDGRYHPAKDTAYEGSVILDDVITSLGGIKSFFPAVIRAAKILNRDDLDINQINERLQNLSDYHYVLLEEEETQINNGQRAHPAGIGKGQIVLSQMVPAAGFDPQSRQWVRTRLGGKISHYGGIPDVEVSPVFPSGIIGIKDRGSFEYNAMVTFARLHPTSDSKPLQKGEASMTTGDGLCMGWCPIAVVCARLGLKDETLPMIRDHIKLWQFYPQGLSHYGPYAVFQRDRHDYHRVNTVRDAGNLEKTFPFAAWPFRHFGTEAIFIVTTALNEMLLQSHEEVIRLCPALPDEMDAAFTLFARGGFKISTQKMKGRINWVWIESLQGNTLNLESPWSIGSPIYVWSRSGEGQISEKPEKCIKVEDGTLTFGTQAGVSYLVSDNIHAVKNWSETTIPAAQNESPKQLGPVILGKPRMF